MQFVKRERVPSEDVTVGDIILTYTTYGHITLGFADENSSMYDNVVFIPERIGTVADMVRYGV